MLGWHPSLSLMRARMISLAFLAGFIMAGAPATAQIATAEQVHVTLTETSDGLVVQWAVPLAYPAIDPPSVLWKADGGSESRTDATLTGVVGVRSGDVSQTMVYAAVLEPVPRGATVEYRVGSDLAGRAGPFTIRNVPGTDESFRFVAYGDIGIDCTAPDGRETVPGCPAHKVRDLAMAQDADLLIVPGDLAYTNTRPGWDAFMRFMEPIQSSVITMPVIGNHEWEESDDAGYHFFLEHYVLPRDEHDFSFQAGPVTFIGLNTDRLCGAGKWSSLGTRAVPCVNGPVNREAIDWFEGALQAAATDDTPWTVVYFHHPPYSWGRHGDNFPVKVLLKDLFETYNVDVVVAAHDHLYSRTHPIVGEREPVATGDRFQQGIGPIYVVAGGGGRTLYDAPEESPPPHFAYATDEFHHITVFDVNATTLSFRALNAQDGTEFDRFSLTRGPVAAVASGDGDAGLLPTPGPSAIALFPILVVAALALARRKGGAA